MNVFDQKQWNCLRTSKTIWFFRNLSEFTKINCANWHNHSASQFGPTGLMKGVHSSDQLPDPRRTLPFIGWIPRVLRITFSMLKLLALIWFFDKFLLSIIIKSSTRYSKKYMLNILYTYTTKPNWILFQHGEPLLLECWIRTLKTPSIRLKVYYIRMARYIHGTYTVLFILQYSKEPHHLNEYAWKYRIF